MTHSGVSYETAEEVHHMYRVDFLLPNQIAQIANVPLPIVQGILTGRLFPELLLHWEMAD